jgi:hypothetical protein
LFQLRPQLFQCRGLFWLATMPLRLLRLTTLALVLTLLRILVSVLRLAESTTGR